MIVTYIMLPILKVMYHPLAWGFWESVCNLAVTLYSVITRQNRFSP